MGTVDQLPDNFEEKIRLFESVIQRAISPHLKTLEDVSCFIATLQLLLMNTMMRCERNPINGFKELIQSLENNIKRLEAKQEDQ